MAKGDDDEKKPEAFEVLPGREVVDPDAELQAIKEQYRESLERLARLARKQSPLAVQRIQTRSQWKRSHDLQSKPIAETPRTPAQLLAARIPETEINGYWPSLATNAGIWAKEITVAAFWADAGVKVEEWSSKEYYQATKAKLLNHVGLPSFVGKENPRLQEKVLGEVGRGKVSEVFPDPAAPVPAIKDLVRCRIETAYLDGVAFLRDKLLAHLGAAGLDVVPNTQARATGYYASHLTFFYPRLFSFNGSVQVSVGCEVQIATELATTIWDRTHDTYEQFRVAAASSDDDGWQWDPNDPRFIAGQLAHMIHLADGLAVQLRDAVSNAKAKGVKK